MRQRLGRLVAFLWGLLKGLGRWLGGILRAVAAAIGRGWRAAAVERSIRASERQQRLIFENLGKMVYLLYKRNLVKNADLVAECEKATVIDATIDELIEQVEQIRGSRPETAGGAFPTVANRPAEVEALAAAGADPGAAEPLMLNETTT